MMPPPHPRERETEELIRRFGAVRAKRRRIRLVAAASGGGVLLAGAVVAVVLTSQTYEDRTANDFNGAGIAAVSSTLVPSALGEPPARTESPAWTEPSAGPERTATTRRITTTELEVATESVAATESVPTTGQATGGTVTATSARGPAAAAAGTAGRVVVIDPGHQAHGDPSLEPIGPGSSDRKAKVSSGASGVATGTPESELVLTVSLKLRDSLQAHGVTVFMTRVVQDVNLSNSERARIANSAGADLFVRIHADASTNPDVAGIHVLYPVSIKGWTDDIAAASKRAASIAQHELIAATGAKDRGIDARSDMTGLNWSDVPVILPEIGFMTNPAEDRKLADPSYQAKIVQGLTRAILAFLGAG